MRSLLAALLVMVGCAWAGAPSESQPPSRADRVEKSAADWRSALSQEQFYILREKGTERPFTGPYWDDKSPGVYACAGCGLTLFHSDAKFDSGTGWPSYFQPIAADRVDRHSDASYGMVRTEVTCARCGGHLGHVFPDGPAPTGLRYCINGYALAKRPVDADAATPAAAEAAPKRDKPARAKRAD